MYYARKYNNKWFLNNQYVEVNIGKWFIEFVLLVPYETPTAFTDL